ncbi:BirA family biotin operon repressor/biotin-[acetyl-CoA-carboxylase] ligase [Virgibacillus natechei]|uniref:Bifunctional ligase/repressor BirA n=1 Tax=Virgibacillus natechei TaxID=1216297 RepID=A0ABS4IF84_9BACI|nr:biotin--[acetyl-CoA-carboxylase] ligase [Virgibacillus natechei]MBP1969588.1 BirA family biotin operon repressor/biotin-[acetyl-CoA-carboxylase] ligase [Virgibacillus natechei]UZD14816.1 biotin--[acetyl-CoA-carboxylase] ligase [Virgibacillus natechei]
MESTRNKLIKILAGNQDKYISGQLLSERLNISRNAVWKHMKELEKDGYVIVGKSNKGYKITNTPNKLSENTIQWGLNTQWLGRTIIHKETTASTQIIAHQAAQDNAKHGTIIIADEQTKGRGRMDRTWHSAQNKGIWLSIILRPAILPYLAPQLTLLTATVLAETIRSYTNTEPLIKWPNDILLNNKKTAGILTEMQAEQDQIQYVVIGIGVNVNQTYNELPQDVNLNATSLQIETNKDWSIKNIIQDLLVTFEKSYETYMKNGFSEVKQKWENSGFKIGENILIKTSRDQWEAAFLGIAEDGALIYKGIDKEEKRLYSGEIEWFQGGEMDYVK